MTTKQRTTGGSFLISLCGTVPSFAPERFDGRCRELAQIARDFFERAVLSRADALERQEPGVMQELLCEAGGLGLLKVEIPEAFEGFGMGKVASAVVTENVAGLGGFSVAFNCQTGIGLLPVLHWGTDEQKERFLPGIAGGEKVAAFALTEEEAGTDALSSGMVARRSHDGRHYVLSGEKVFISNGGIADLVTLFAKTEGDRLTAFVVERETPGFAVGPENEKMGISGSSNTSIKLTDAMVPAANVVGDVGCGHKVALGTLALGRFKLGAACVGDCKRLIAKAVEHANTREQFGRPLGSFELIRQKLARMTARTYLLESLIYRLAGDYDAAMQTHAAETVVEDFSVESSIAKVFGSETLAFVADEAMQIFGGRGYARDGSIERHYRDCRIYRIFEGTNEINRLLIPGVLLKRALAGRLPLMERLQEILGWLKTGFPKIDPSKPIATLVDQVEVLKRLAIYVSGVAAQKLGEKLKERQAIAATIADLVIASYAFDSGIARALAAIDRGEKEQGVHFARICEASLAERVPQLLSEARQALINIADGNANEYTPHLKALARIIELPCVNTDELYGGIAEQLLKNEL